MTQLGTNGRVRRPWWQARRPPLGGNPVRWRERHVQGIAPLAWMRNGPRWLGLTAFVLACLAALLLLMGQRTPGPTELFTLWQDGGVTAVLGAANGIGRGPLCRFVAYHGIGTLAVVSLLVAIRASASITEEREHGTWDGLLLTPMPTRRIVDAKFRAIVTAALPYVTVYAVCTIPLASLIRAEAGLVGIGMTVALVAGVVFVAATGIYWSARLRSSWRSLLATLAAGYLGWQFLVVPISLALALMVEIGPAGFVHLSRTLSWQCLFMGWPSWGTELRMQVLLLAAGVGVALAWLLAQIFLRWAARRIDQCERTGVLSVSDYAIFRSRHKEDSRTMQQVRAAG